MNTPFELLLDRKKGGFVKISEPPAEKKCRSKEHTPPMHIVLEPGVYEYECPDCGEKKIINVAPRPTL